MSVVIKVENLYKQYRLGEVGTGSMKDDFKRWRYRMMGKEDPFLTVGEENDRTVKATSKYVWALKDINFEVQQGEILGIIGRNGAGKSTLLKILSRTTGPTKGSLKMKGRVASLLEVGTGFHGELSGRENIYLNGAIMGMHRHEITRKLDEIIDFAGVEKYIDTPVKRYSSGMYVRLAFGVAAHLEPDIMIVDEVLAVGDLEFQKKAIGKMKDVSTQNGRTVLFVSHNMAAVTNLCEKGLLLFNGRIETMGSIDRVISAYQLSNRTVSKDLTDFERTGTGTCRITKINIKSENEIVSDIQRLGDKINIEIFIKNASGRELTNLRIIIGVYNLNDEGYLRFDTQTIGQQINIPLKGTKVICKINEHLNIKPDQYSMNIAILKGEETIDYVAGAGKFFIENFDYYGTGETIQNPELSKVFYKHSWETC
jgi:lipopolysaccharide transport system ATP-binding protein